ncbi:hypothetical protein [Polynucleobacter corsicus]|uniref:hypothetical protein n=1 Tax=Polynucleobacter corsicus TaxID=2081042 RepID=UPI001BFE9AFE|nr:hypothetical protein [Polynucleobacter corsicus]QWE19338.1 hypothetical protein C2747_03675 [Polynucleobacter corsicus]
MKIILVALLLLAGLVHASPSDEEIAKEVIKESIANYKGVCPCPYSTHPDGRQCGYRSVYSSKSASAPICYSITVTPKMIEDYKDRYKP